MSEAPGRSQTDGNSVIDSNMKERHFVMIYDIEIARIRKMLD